MKKPRGRVSTGLLPYRLLPVWLALVLAGSAGDLAAQASQPDSGSFWGSVLGEPASRSRLIAGAWALHPFEPQFPEFEWSQAFGLVSGQWVGATFVNSYGERGFIGAVERDWWSVGTGSAEAGVGYRAGVVTGYDERLLSLAGTTPVMPFVGLVVWAAGGPFTLDVFYAYRGISVETGIRFH